MIQWFKASAPIRKKFNVLFFVHTVLAAIGVGTTWLALSGAGSAATLMGAALGAFVATAAVVLGSKKLICDPYVDTVVRMEGLAGGDLTSPIKYLEHADCVGRMTRAMEVFKRNAEAVQAAVAAQQQIVTALGAGLSKLADSDLSHRIEQVFPADYEKLRIDYNRAMDAVGG